MAGKKGKVYSQEGKFRYLFLFGVSVDNDVAAALKSSKPILRFILPILSASMILSIQNPISPTMIEI